MKTYWCSQMADNFPHALYVQQLRLRKSVFVDGYGWQLPISGDKEYDQYDLPLAQYCLTEHEGRLVSSARVLPTTLELGSTSYMIRDASLGRLGADLPPELCKGFTPPECPHVWEATRLTVAPELTKDQKRAALFSTVSRMNKEARANDVRDLIAIGGVELPIGLRFAGFSTERLTPYFHSASGRIAIFKLSVVHL